MIDAGNNLPPITCFLAKFFDEEWIKTLISSCDAEGDGQTPLNIFDPPSSAYETELRWLREFAKEVLSLRRVISIHDEILFFLGLVEDTINGMTSLKTKPGTIRKEKGMQAGHNRMWINQTRGK